MQCGFSIDSSVYSHVSGYSWASTFAIAQVMSVGVDASFLKRCVVNPASLVTCCNHVGNMAFDGRWRQIRLEKEGLSSNLSLKEYGEPDRRFSHMASPNPAQEASHGIAAKFCRSSELAVSSKRLAF